MAEICSVCGLPKELCVCEDIAREQQDIQITTTKRRYGKVVTIISGIDPTDIDLEELARFLKNRCAAGGTVKDGIIELQGDHKKKAMAALKEKGYTNISE
ncbi:MAG TPA: stress response translation initiation inhibitor YciH [Euryarchaeota archaeon]|nr:MAG: stress response translation initiation inhibitor YciH [Thermoplasmata archaeon]HHD16122.1 stress response translation initiation inhibitor YciH [Euryarchaeota archaeon]